MCARRRNSTGRSASRATRGRGTFPAREMLMQLEPKQIEAALGIEAGSEVVAYYHSGSRSAIATQMLRALGYDARNFVGSWHEWSRHDDLPVER